MEEKEEGVSPEFPKFFHPKHSNIPSQFQETATNLHLLIHHQEFPAIYPPSKKLIKQTLITSQKENENERKMKAKLEIRN